MATLFLGIGLVFVIEGLVLALAPLRIEDILRLFAGLSRDQRRAIGLMAVGIGTVLVFLSHLNGR